MASEKIIALGQKNRKEMDIILEKYKSVKQELEVIKRIGNPLNKDLSTLKIYIVCIDAIIEGLDPITKGISKGLLEGKTYFGMARDLKISKGSVEYKRNYVLSVEFMKGYQFLLENVLGGEFEDVFPTFES